MRTKEELYAGCSEMITKLRKSAGLSRAKLANKIDIDERRLKRMESGDDAPTIPEFVSAIEATGMKPLPLLLEYLYPETYCITPRSTDSEIRNAVCHYVKEIATPRVIRQLAYLFTGQHGSNMEPQMQLITIINHLPLQYRILICKQVVATWDLANLRGETINPGHVQPDIEMLNDAIGRAELAVSKMQSAYTSIK